jgi:Sec-independent protein translocase protein TatA
MFDIGFGEILLVILIVFLICPKDIPVILKKIGQFLAGLQKIKDEIFDIKNDLTETVTNYKKDTLDDFKISKDILTKTPGKSAKKTVKKKIKRSSK